MDSEKKEILKKEEVEKIVKELMKIEGNCECADCGDPDPQWASTNLGLFICITCSGIHRNLGVHISRVKSLSLDNWTTEEIKVLQSVGNLKAKEIWEHYLPKYFIRPGPSDSVALKEQWIRSKYERKEFIESETNRKNAEQCVKPSKEGYLTKKGNVVKNWKRRWFVLNDDSLKYYKKTKDAQPAGIIELTEVVAFDALNDTCDSKPYCFVISTKQRDFYISADSGKIMFDWVQSLRAAKEKCCPSSPTTPVASSSPPK